ncbi:MAG: metal-dependent transcriptional regulator [Sphingomonadales bacterium]|nr:metal-dependent transcriptional regulator [Sphingomonadales bacterium]
MLKQTRSTENYLKAIFRLSGLDFGGLSEGELPYTVGTNDLATELQAKASSVTDMLLKLAERGYVDYVPYQGAVLTSNGIYLAYQVVRRHRLWEYFLAHRLGFSSFEIHDLAEEMEHVRSLALTDRLAEYLDGPQWDPHGDPIPAADGQMPFMKREFLWDAMQSMQNLGDWPEVKFSLCGLGTRDPELLKSIQNLGMRLGITLHILASVPGLDDLCGVILSNIKEVQIPSVMAKQMLVVRKYPFGMPI